jgi:hypothetical protein
VVVAQVVVKHVMPKVHALEHEDLLQKLLEPHNKDTAMHFVNDIIHFASNKLPFPNAKSRNSSSSTLEIEHDMIRWLFLEENSNLLQHLLSIKEPTIDAFAESLFRVAVECGDMRLIKTMVLSGVDLDRSRIKNGYTPLQYSVDNGNWEMIRFFLDSKANVNPPLHVSGISPLHLAIIRKNSDFVRLLLNAGARVDVMDLFGSPLHTAAEFKHMEAAQMLLSEGADINFMNDCGETPLHIAVVDGSIEIVNLFLNAGADVNASATGFKTVLEVAM